MSKRINLIIESEELLDTHLHIINDVMKKYIARHGEKNRYTIHLFDKQVNIYGTGQKCFEGDLYILGKEQKGRWIRGGTSDE